MAKIKKSNPRARSENQEKAKTVSPQPVVSPELKIDVTPEAIIEKKKWSIFGFKFQAIVVASLAFVFYINSAWNEFAHDDGIVIMKNEYVQEGFAGMWNILTCDAYASYYRQLNTTNQLTGGRYRPLSILTFAIEQQFFGAVPVEKVDSFLKTNLSYGVRGPQEQKVIGQMQVRHVFNVLWYMLLVVVVLYFLRYIVFSKSPMIAFLAAILFTIHPIHTEVVANVKSRDEIMSLLFMCLTFICAFKFEEQKNYKFLAFGIMSYFLAFLSKEYAITMVFLLPFSFYLFRGYSIKKSILVFLPYLIVVFAYLFIRIKVADNSGSLSFTEIVKVIRNATDKSSDNALSSAQQEVLNNPYFYATPTQKTATEISTTMYYLRLLLYPHPLSADYSYDTIPFKTFSDLSVYLSILVHLGLFVLMWYYGFIKKNAKVVSFAIAFYLVHLLMVCNLIFDIGATLGERLIFHSSLGFAIVVAFLLYKGMEKLQPKWEKAPIGLFGLIAVFVLLSGFKTIQRNADWKNDFTLFSKDIEFAPNSILVNANVAAALITKADFEKSDTLKKNDLHKAIELLDKGIELHKHTFVAGFLNRGVAYYKLGEIDKAKADMDSVRMLYPTYPTLKNMSTLIAGYYMKKGWDSFGRVGKYPEAIIEFQKGLQIDSTNADLWYNLGGAYYSNKQLTEAINAWQRTLKLKPDYEQAKQGLQATMGIINMIQNEKKGATQKVPDKGN